MKFEMDIPEEITKLLKISSNEDEFKRNAFILYPYIHNRTITIEEVARILNVDYITMCMFYFNHDFDLEIGEYGSITVFVKIKDDNYTPKVDTAFIKLANMKKIKEGVYHSDEDVVRDCYTSAKALMKREWFRDTVELLVWKVGDEVEDLKRHFFERLEEDGELY